MLDEKCCSHWFFLFDLALECLKILANNLVKMLKNIKKMAVSKLMKRISRIYNFSNFYRTYFYVLCEYFISAFLS